MLSTGWPKLGFSVSDFFLSKHRKNRQRLQFLPPLQNAAPGSKAHRPRGGSTSTAPRAAPHGPSSTATRGCAPPGHQRRAVHWAGSGARAAERYPLAQGCTPGKRYRRTRPKKNPARGRVGWWEGERLRQPGRVAIGAHARRDGGYRVSVAFFIVPPTAPIVALGIVASRHKKRSPV